MIFLLHTPRRPPFNLCCVEILSHLSFAFSFSYPSSSLCLHHALKSCTVIVWPPPLCLSLAPPAALCPLRSMLSPLSGSPWLWEVGVPLRLPLLRCHHCPLCHTVGANTCPHLSLPAPCLPSLAAHTASPPWPPHPPPLYPRLTHPDPTRPPPPSHLPHLKGRTSCSLLRPHMCHVVWAPAVGRCWSAGWGGRRNWQRGKAQRGTGAAQARAAGEIALQRYLLHGVWCCIWSSLWNTGLCHSLRHSSRFSRVLTQTFLWRTNW